MLILGSYRAAGRTCSPRSSRARRAASATRSAACSSRELATDVWEGVPLLELGLFITLSAITVYRKELSVNSGHRRDELPARAAASPPPAADAAAGAAAAAASPAPPGDAAAAAPAAASGG